MRKTFCLILLVLLPGVVLCQLRSRTGPIRDKFRIYENQRLGFKFKYNPDIDNFPEGFDTDTTNWERIALRGYGISFNSPKPYSIKRTEGFFSSTWYPPTDSVIRLDFAKGVFVQVYETQRSFHEIAFAEDFLQYVRPFGVHPEDQFDTLPKTINDSSWVTLNCGIPFAARKLFGYSWKGFRGVGCMRVQLPEDMGSGTTIASYSHAFVTHAISSDATLVLDFYDQHSEGDQPYPWLNETMFYEMISSLSWIERPSTKQ